MINIPWNGWCAVKSLANWMAILIATFSSVDYWKSSSFSFQDPLEFSRTTIKVVLYFGNPENTERDPLWRRTVPRLKSPPTTLEGNKAPRDAVKAANTRRTHTRSQKVETAFHAIRIRRTLDCNLNQIDIPTVLCVIHQDELSSCGLSRSRAVSELNL